MTPGRASASSGDLRPKGIAVDNDDDGDDGVDTDYSALVKFFYFPHTHTHTELVQRLIGIIM